MLKVHAEFQFQRGVGQHHESQMDEAEDTLVELEEAEREAEWQEKKVAETKRMLQSKGGSAASRQPDGGQPVLPPAAGPWPAPAPTDAPAVAVTRKAAAEASAAAAMVWASAAASHEAAAEAAAQRAAAQPASHAGVVAEEWQRAHAAWRAAHDALKAATQADPDAEAVREAAAAVTAVHEFKRQRSALRG